MYRASRFNVQINQRDTTLLMNDFYYPLFGCICFGLSPVHHQEHHLINSITHCRRVQLLCGSHKLYKALVCSCRRVQLLRGCTSTQHLDSQKCAQDNGGTQTTFASTKQKNYRRCKVKRVKGMEKIIYKRMKDKFVKLKENLSFLSFAPS